jgi:hypothetical protein
MSGEIVSTGTKIRGQAGASKEFFPASVWPDKITCGRRGMGYVFIALENGRSVFPV